MLSQQPVGYQRHADKILNDVPILVATVTQMIYNAMPMLSKKRMPMLNCCHINK